MVADTYSLSGLTGSAVQLVATARDSVLNSVDSTQNEIVPLHNPIMMPPIESSCWHTYMPQQIPQFLIWQSYFEHRDSPRKKNWQTAASQGIIGNIFLCSTQNVTMLEFKCLQEIGKGNQGLYWILNSHRQWLSIKTCWTLTKEPGTSIRDLTEHRS